jgi:hypothetical protein
MALSASIKSSVREASSKAKRISQVKARAIAELYLIDEVGDLTTTGDVTKIDGFWRFSILVGNARQGLLGQIGAIDVDVHTGETSLPQSREELLANAKRLYRSSP